MIDDPQWVEKYRPTTVAETILPKGLKDTFQAFVDSGTIPNIVLSGGPGIGKTTVAKAMMDEMDIDYMMINGSNEGRLIDTLRTKITAYASSISLTGGRKMVLIDEADYMNRESVQPALRNFIEEYSSNCGFILTCNFLNNIIGPLQSRTPPIEFSIPNDEKAQLAGDFMKRVETILRVEGVEYERKAVAGVIQRHFPDFRRVLGELQIYASRGNGKIDSGIMAHTIDTKFSELITAMKKKDFSVCRKWVGENLESDFDILVRAFYISSKKHFVENSIPQLILNLNDYQYKHTFVADPQINAMAMLVEIMVDCEFKK